MVRYKTQILNITKEGKNSTTFILKNPLGHKWENGANTHLALPGFDLNPQKIDSSLVHHMSISSIPEEEIISFSTRFKDKPSKYKKVLSNLKEGDEVTIYETKSHMKLNRDGKNLVFISMGIAIATFRPFILEYFKNQDGINSLTVLSCDKKDHHIMDDLLVDNKDKSYKAQKVEGRSNLLKELDSIFGNGLGTTDFYIAGSDGMMIDMIRLLINKGVHLDNIFLDRKPVICEKYKNPETRFRTGSKIVF